MNASSLNESSGQKMYQMCNLLEEIKEIQKNTKNVDEGLTRVQEIIRQSSELVENSMSPNEIVIDAKILQEGSYFFNSNVVTLNTNLTSFSEEMYVNGILNYIENSSDVCPVGHEWKALAPVTFHLFKKSDPISFMLGPLKLSPLTEETVVEKPRAERQKKVPVVEKNVLTCVQDIEKQEEDNNDIYDHILRCLVRCYKANEKKPVNYFKFIVHPGDYWKTIENIFHFSFLVRDGTVKMSTYNNLPFVEPVLKKKGSQSETTSMNQQFCFTLSMSDWEKLVEKFNITSPSIPAFVRRGSGK